MPEGSKEHRRNLQTHGNRCDIIRCVSHPSRNLGPRNSVNTAVFVLEVLRGHQLVSAVSDASTEAFRGHLYLPSARNIAVVMV